MKTFKSYFSDEEITKSLARKRSKASTNISSKRLIWEITNERHKEYELIQNNYKELFALLPNRRQLKRSRLDKRTSLSLGTKIHEKSIVDTIKVIRKYQIKNIPKWLGKLNLFIENIQRKVNLDKFELEKPYISGMIKDKAKKIYRPIVSYKDLSDSIILSKTFQYLANYFDKYFLDCSYAFRTNKKKHLNDEIPNRNHALQKIIDFKLRHENEKIYVTECDLQKFFDTVNHTVLKEKLDNSIQKVDEVFSYQAKKIVDAFLNSYCFKDALDTGDQDEKLYFQKNEYLNIILKKYPKYETEDYNNIGIPQGGALSGFFANLLLDYADKAIYEACKDDINNDKLLYIRYCDDIIIIGIDRKACQKALDIYFSVIEDLKLIPHPCNEKPLNYKSKDCIKEFWEAKSKSVYCWGEIDKGYIPWISFLGYDIHHSGFVRIRRKTIEKHRDKIKEEIYKIKKVINMMPKEKINLSIDEIYKKTENHLVAMSVGKKQLNRKSIYSWSGAMQFLKDNPQATQNNSFLKRQICLLDKIRGTELKKLMSFLMKNLSEGEAVLIFDFDIFTEEANDSGLIPINSPKKNKMDYLKYSKSYYRQFFGKIIK